MSGSSRECHTNHLLQFHVVACRVSQPCSRAFRDWQIGTHSTDMRLDVVVGSARVVLQRRSICATSPAPGLSMQMYFWWPDQKMYAHIGGGGGGVGGGWGGGHGPLSPYPLTTPLRHHSQHPAEFVLASSLQFLPHLCYADVDDRVYVWCRSDFGKTLNFDFVYINRIRVDRQTALNIDNFRVGH